MWDGPGASIAKFGCRFGGGSGVKPDPFWRVEEFAFE
ncbi:hypothetical protein VULLAG_LOCUS4017 [Vulpes lagopus]